MFSVKGAVGSGMSAAGALQTAASLLAVYRQEIPPTCGFQNPPPDCALDVSAEARRLEIGNLLQNARGVGAINSCMVFRAARF